MREQPPHLHERIEHLRESIALIGEQIQSVRTTMALMRVRRAVRTPARVHENALPLVLTDRELRILQLIADGADNAEIAEALHFSLGTIKLHVREILQKLDTPNRTVAAVRAVRAGLI